MVLPQETERTFKRGCQIAKCRQYLHQGFRASLDYRYLSFIAGSQFPLTARCV